MLQLPDRFGQQPESGTIFISAAVRLKALPVLKETFPTLIISSEDDKVTGVQRR